MDEECTREYRESCSQCSAVDWAITDEGQFYCRSCHNVIERTQEVEDSGYLANSRISSISKKPRNKTKLEHGREWLVCEGFQFILKYQAEALLSLGVCPQFKDDVLWSMWRRYLQKSQQAYTRNPVHAGRFRVAYESDSAPESLGLSDFSMVSESETEGEGTSGTSGPSSASGWCSDGASPVCSGSLDAGFYSSAKYGRALTLMTMPMTLAFCHLALLWLREALTLADLLRFVAEGHVPYINAHQAFPEEMKLYGRDIRVFKVESIPSHRRVQQQANQLAVFLGLPVFPPISMDCLLHPSLLCLRYLIEANLPDELHGWVSKVAEQAGIGEEAFLTYDPTARKAQLRSYDLQAAALIIVSMKLLFKLDDRVEWTLSKGADEENQRNQELRIFSLLQWYRTVQPALDLARGREEHNLARQTWKPCKPLYPSKKEKSVVLKRRRVVEQLQADFQRLSGLAPEPQRHPPSSFRFQWGEDKGFDGPSFYHQTLDSALRQSGGPSSCLSNPKYWHTALRPCDPRHCSDHYPEVEPTLPRSYVWVLGLFSFLLGVGAARVHAEVCQVERRLVGNRSARGRRGRSPT